MNYNRNIERPSNQMGLGSSSGLRFPFIHPNDDQFASKTYANIIYDEYRDYQQRFQPYENKVLSLAESRELLDQQLSRITTNVDRSFANPNMNAGALQLQRYGVNQNQQEKSSRFRNDDMNKALSTAHARNNTRVSDGDRREGLIIGSNTVRNDATRQLEG
jgi:hypothetical protein